MVTTNEPDVTVTDVPMIKTRTYGNAGKIALIGAFPISTFLIDSFTKIPDSHPCLLCCIQAPCSTGRYNSHTSHRRRIRTSGRSLH